MSQETISVSCGDMLRLILILLLPLTCFAQGFGSYTFDQPYLAQSRILLGGVDLTNGLVAYWTMDETGNINREDSTSGNRDLTDEHTNVQATPTTAKYGNAAFFEGFNENNKLLSSDAAFGGNGTFTVGLWAKSHFEDNLNPIITRYNVTGWGVWSLFFYESRMKTIFADSGGTWYSLTNYATGNYNSNWIYYAFGYDADNAKGWASTNGVIFAETAALTGGLTNVVSGTIPLAVGNWTGLDNAWHGLISEVGYWNRRLSTNEVISLYNSGNGLTYTNFYTVRNP